MKATYSKRMLNLHFKQSEHNKAEHEIMTRKLSRKGYTVGIVTADAIERKCNYMAPLGHTVAMIKADYKAIKTSLVISNHINTSDHLKLGRLLDNFKSISTLDNRFRALGWNPTLVIDCGHSLVITTNDNIEYVVSWSHGSTYSAMSFKD
jgi:hypothetical protein